MRAPTRLLIGAAGAIALVAGASGWLLGPGAPWLVSTLADGRTVWRLGTLDVSGVSGASLAELRIARATLSDAQGVWIEARDIAVTWRPFALLGGDVRIAGVTAQDLHVVRRPALSPPRPRGEAPDVTLEQLAVARLAFDKAAFGAAAAFAVTGALETKAGEPVSAALDLRGLETTRDSATLRLARRETLALTAHVDGPKGGFFAAALGAERPVTVDLTAQGGADRGAGALSARIGEDALADGKFDWTGDAWRLDGMASLAHAPALAPLARATGADLRVTGAGARTGARAFTLAVSGSAAEVKLAGRLDAQGRLAPGAEFNARADHLEAFTPDVSRGAATFAGTLTRTRDASVFAGDLAVSALRSGALETDFAGPVTVRVTQTQAEIDASGPLSRVGGAPIMQRLLARARFTFDGRYDRRAQRLVMHSATVESASARATASGALGPGADGLNGRWRVSDARAIDPRFSGAAEGAFTLTGGFAGAPFRLGVEGAGERFSAGLGPFDPLLGARPKLSGVVTVLRGVTQIEQATATGPALRLGATGPVRNGVADLAVEASARGPVRFGAATIDGVADARGTIKGPLEAPTLVLTTDLSAFEAGGVTVQQPRIALTLAPAGTAHRGRVEATGAIGRQRVQAGADISVDDAALRFTNVQADLAGLSARGAAAFTDAGPLLDLRLDGRADTLLAPLTGRLEGTVRTRAVGRAAELDADLRFTQGRVGAFRIDAARLTANGLFNDLRVRSSVRGAASGAVVDVDLDGAVRRKGEMTQVTLRPSGAVAGATLGARAPVDISFAPAGATARADLTLGDGALRLDYGETRDALRLSARLDNAPLAPIAAVLGEEATGRVTGTLQASGDGALQGDADLTITDALFARRARDPVTMQLSGRIDKGTMTLRASATSRNGLEAALDANAPVAARARPLRIALAGEGQATWRAKGPADALWGIVGSLDQNVSGVLDGRGTLRFAVGRLSGEGGLDLTKGRFADRSTGVDLRDIAARVRFADDGARLESFSARDSRGGVLTGTGAAQGLQRGRVDLVAKGVQLLGRPDAQATGSGPVSLVWSEKGATLTGDLTLDSALLAPPRTSADIPELDVIEINRPGIEDGESETPRAPTLLPQTQLDVRIRAPARVLLRGRGLDSEWSVDLRARGDAAAPRVFGEARLVRGRFTLAGRPFEAQRGVIRFNGAPEEALIDLVAELDTPSLTVTAALSGPVNDPEVTLSSTPALPEDEILPQALFGRAAADLSALEAAQLAASLAELAGQSSLNLTGAARDLVGLDRLDVRETTGGLRVAGGKYLTRNVYLEVARTGIGETETEVEWRVRPQLNIVSAFQAAGDTRVSVRWRREY